MSSFDILFYVYPMDNKEEFEKLKQQFEGIKNLSEINKFKSIMIVANKCDLDEDQRQVPTTEAFKYALQKKFLFIEVSAKTGYNIDEMLMQNTKHYLDKIFPLNYGHLFTFELYKFFPPNLQKLIHHFICSHHVVIKKKMPNPILLIIIRDIFKK